MIKRDLPSVRALIENKPLTTGPVTDIPKSMSESKDDLAGMRAEFDTWYRPGKNSRAKFSDKQRAMYFSDALATLKRNFASLTGEDAKAKLYALYVELMDDEGEEVRINAKLDAEDAKKRKAAQKILDKALSLALKNPSEAANLASTALKMVAQLPFEGGNGANKALWLAADNLLKAFKGYAAFWSTSDIS